MTTLTNEILYIKQIIGTFAQLDMSVMCISNEGIGATNQNQTMFVIGKNNPVFSFKSLCTRDRISELSERINKFDDTELILDLQQNNEVKSIQIKSKNNKIKSMFTCMKESVISGKEKTLEDIAAGSTASPRERPPKKINNNITEQYIITMLSDDDISDIKDVRKMIGCDTVLFSLIDDKILLSFVSELRAEKASIDIQTKIQYNTSATSFAHRYNINSLLTIFKHFKTTSFAICNNGLLKVASDNIDIYLTPIKNQI